MSKGPITAIIVAIVALFGIYFIADIKPGEIKENTLEVPVEDENEFVAKYVATLSPDNQKKVGSLLAKAKNEQDKSAVDELISFYEAQQQFNFAAYYHSLKAELYGDSENWEIAGDRQISVSSNDAYDPEFNTVLYEQSLKSYQTALDLAPENLDLQVKLGSAIVERSPQPMQGISLLLGVIEQDSMHVNANLALGKFGIISAQYDKAVIRLEKVLSSQPENTEALFLIAEAYSSLGNNKQAVESLEKCKQLVENEDLKKEIDAYLQQLLQK